MENKKLILDYSKWISGDGGKFATGEGKAALLNKERFMCCLGQWSLQRGASEDMIMSQGEPSDLNIFLPGLNVERGHNDGYINTQFSDDAIAINDDPDTDPETKINLLSKLCKDNGFELEVINRPPTTE